MNIQFLDPLTRALARMKKALFKPFDLKKWFVVGFTAFLADLSDYARGGGSQTGRESAGDFNWDEAINFPQRAREWLQDNPEWFALIIAGICVILVLIVLFTWLSSRGKFMFLDNVIHDQAQVTKPWQEFRVQGNSLFSWYLIFIFTALTVFILYLVNCYNYLYDLYNIDMDIRALLFPGVWMVIGFLVLWLLVSFIDLLLSDFIVPLMYRYRLSTADAWHMFLPLLYAHFGHFLGYAVMVFGIYILVVLGVIVVGLFTCCIGFLFLIIPYINSVTLLPVSYTMRAFSVEFIEQFGPDFKIFPASGSAENFAPNPSPK
jgi:hypothetical protein